MRNAFTIFSLLLAFALPPAASASPVDLGEGLRYLRVSDLAAVPEEIGDAPLVVDLRRSGGGNTDRLEAILRSNGAVRFVLLGKDTAPDIRRFLGSRSAAVITLAVQGVDPDADVVLNTSPEEDLRAYDAHENGRELALLIQPPVRKTRRDEAAIVRDRVNGRGAAQAENPSAESDNGEPPIVDMVLQRAVQLHRGLKALGRL